MNMFMNACYFYEDVEIFIDFIGAFWEFFW